MNIQEAKEQIERAVKIYLMKDSYGNYRIPLERQRPVFLLGAPGIGKTAIMEQIARELDLALVSYSMTHHTRQSALGLPFIRHRNYQGTEFDVSEYTMSEIIASVYEVMEQTGKKEGILFLDEINCVSETLAPSMLQFLQYKTFGMHQIPKGWVVATAGNPPQFNRSVREFDVVTLRRLLTILKGVKEELGKAVRWDEQTAVGILQNTWESLEQTLAQGEEAHSISETVRTEYQKSIEVLQEDAKAIRMAGTYEPESAFALIKERFESQVGEMKREGEQISGELSNLFRFVEKVFGQGNEMLILVTDLTVNGNSAKFIGRRGSKEYEKYNKKFQIYERQQEIADEVEKLQL